MAYIDQAAPHAGSAEVLFTSMFDEPAGTLARTMPRGTVSGAAIAAVNTTGTVACRAVPLAQGTPISNITIITGATAAVAPTHFWLGLADANLNVLAVSADQGSAAIANATLFKLAMTVPVIIQFTGLYYVLCSTSATTTAPSLTGATLAAGLALPGPAICGTGGTQAAPPAIGAQLGGGTVNANGAQNFAAWLS